MSSASRGRLAGFLALGALLVLVGFAFWSGRDTVPAALPPAPPVEPTASVPSTSFTESIPAAPPPGSVITDSLETIALSPQARILAERFQCVCGCGDILVGCACTLTPGSRDMKQYLQQLVDEGKTPTEVEHAMVARYGPTVLP